MHSCQLLSDLVIKIFIHSNLQLVTNLKILNCDTPETDYYAKIWIKTKYEKFSNKNWNLPAKPEIRYDNHHIPHLNTFYIPWWSKTMPIVGKILKSRSSCTFWKRKRFLSLLAVIVICAGRVTTIKVICGIDLLFFY